MLKKFSLKPIPPSLFLLLILGSCSKKEELEAVRPQEEYGVLSQDDVRGANALMTLIRNSDAFASWIGDKPLSSNLKVVVGSLVDPPSSVVEDLDVERGLSKKSKSSPTLYVVNDPGNDQIAPRSIVLIEETTSITIEEKILPDDPQSLVKLVSQEVTTELKQVEEDDMDSKSDRAKLYEDVISKLCAPGADECMEMTDPVGPNKAAPKATKVKLCRVSAVATELIRAASVKATQLAAEMARVAGENKYKFDTSAPKKVTFTKRNGKVAQVIVSGFIRGVDEDKELVAPDAVSKFVVEIDGEGKLKIVDRSPKTEVNPANLNF